MSSVVCVSSKCLHVIHPIQIYEIRLLGVGSLRVATSCVYLVSAYIQYIQFKFVKSDFWGCKPFILFINVYTSCDIKYSLHFVLIYHVYIYICTYIDVYIYIYIYLSLSLYIYIYIYIYVFFFC